MAWEGLEQKKKEKKLLWVAINDENSTFNKENGLDRGIFYHIFCFMQLHMCLDRRIVPNKGLIEASMPICKGDIVYL